MDSKESLSDKANKLKLKYNLTDCGFDTECIYQEGDLSNLLKELLVRLLPTDRFEITETITEDSTQFLSTIKYKGQKLVEVFADTHADFLPDNFTEVFESIPEKMKSSKKFYSINPMLTGQAMWYFCGFDNDLIQAKAEGLPLVLPGEDFMDEDISQYE